jgi:type II secretory pathway predicted ATPase ExeA
MLTRKDLERFGLSDVPFTKDLAPDDFWLTSHRQGAIDRVMSAIQARQSVLLCGDPGVGKTCVMRAVREALPPAGYRLTYCHNVTLGRRDFYRQLTVALGLNAKATAAALFHAVSTHVTELGRERIHPVFVLDEAHLLHQDTLDHLHILMNYEWDRKPLLSLILVGLPELDDRLRMRRNRSLHSRMTTRVWLDPLGAHDTPAYIAARLATAGCDREVFARDAIGLVHEAARGILRDIDRLCLLGLHHAARADRTLVERDHILTAIHDDDVEGAAE